MVEKYYDKVVDPKANNGWEWVYLSQKEDIFNIPDLKKSDGSCFGSCCALAKEIIRSGKILSAPELQKIEQGEKFPKRALGFQLIQTTNRDICERVSDTYHTPAFERPSNLTNQEKDTLGKLSEFFVYQRQIDCLKTYNLSFKDVSQLSIKKIKILFNLLSRNISFEFATKEIFKNSELDSGNKLIDWIEINGFPNPFRLPDEKGFLRPASIPIQLHPELIYPKNSHVQSHEHFYLSKEKLEKTDLIKEFPQVDHKEFSGFFIITGSDSEDAEAGHTLLLEIDNKTATYVLYDNNLGFYQGDYLEQFFVVLNVLWSTYKYKVRQFHPYEFKNVKSA